MIEASNESCFVEIKYLNLYELFMCLQEDISDVEELGGGSAPVTSQPMGGSATQAMPVFAMPAPPATSATENTALNSSMQQSYTPGTQTGK